VVGKGKTLFRIVVALKGPALPGAAGRDLRNAARIGDIGDGRTTLGVGDQDDVGLIVEDQFVADLQRTGRVGLVVRDDDLDGVGLAVDFDAVRLTGIDGFDRMIG
jgi:hypothetical protein